jgi:hypothetical protein
MKHTPGPWFLWALDGSDFTAISTVPKQPHSHKIDMDHEVLGSSEWLRVSDEDLRLMVAAPELLEACKAALRKFPADAGCSLTTQLLDSIAKAEGP